jgi:hypothetical protein
MSKIEQIITVENSTNFDCIYVEGEVFTYKNSGLTRKVYENANKTFVIKIHVDECVNWNKREFKVWEGAHDVERQKMAQTQHLKNGYIKQEFLYSLDDERTKDFIQRDLTMKEIRFAQSCRNDVGFDKNGNLKCFDLEEYKNY